MRPLTFKLKAKPPCLVDAAGLRPQALAGQAREDILRIALPGWNQSFAVGDLFSVSGEDAGRVVLEGADGSLIRVGAGLEGGELTVSGHAGDYAGEAMRGGTLVVDGEAGDYLGAEMRAGTISVSGDAGAFAGSGRAGAMKGMSGGCIVIRGSAGERAGDRMRRGLLLVEGGVGSYCAARMIAGTIVALGHVGTSPGYLMRRGTVLLADSRVGAAAHLQRQRRAGTARDPPAARVAVPVRAGVPALRQAAAVPALAGRPRVLGQGEILCYCLNLEPQRRRGADEQTAESSRLCGSAEAGSRKLATPQGLVADSAVLDAPRAWRSAGARPRTWG